MYLIGQNDFKTYGNTFRSEVKTELKYTHPNQHDTQQMRTLSTVPHICQVSGLGLPRRDWAGVGASPALAPPRPAPAPRTPHRPGPAPDSAPAQLAAYKHIKPNMPRLRQTQQVDNSVLGWGDQEKWVTLTGLRFVSC